ncbi:MAG: DUF1573 domain-containing protein [Planctomycetia bacterium]|nr:DUF1573 domain-containing protein [Planctomycetia bacterium]
MNQMGDNIVIKMNCKYFYLFLICILLGANADICKAQTGVDQWAVSMFTEMGTAMAHDFGSVALHADVEHRFIFKNLYLEDVVVDSVQSNCGCTKASITKTVIHSMETAEVVARIDTSGKEHTKRRKATITVHFKSPLSAEVQLQVRTYIRADVGFEPGFVEFGTVQTGKVLSKTVFLRYEGNRPDWALTGLKKSNPGFRADAREIERANGHVVYQVDITLKEDAQQGYINDILRFTTNEADSASASVFLPIRGLIMEPLTAKPSILQMGVIRPGEKITKNLVVRASTPFLVTRIHSNDSHMNFLVANRKSTVHVIPITYTAGDVPGTIDEDIIVETDQTELSALKISVFGVISSLPQADKSGIAQKETHKDTAVADPVPEVRLHPEDSNFTMDRISMIPAEKENGKSGESSDDFLNIADKPENPASNPSVQNKEEDKNSGLGGNRIIFRSPAGSVSGFSRKNIR